MQEPLTATWLTVHCLSKLKSFKQHTHTHIHTHTHTLTPKLLFHNTLCQVYNEQVNDEPGNYGAGFLGLRPANGAAVCHNGPCVGTARSVGIMNTGITDAELRKKWLGHCCGVSAHT